MNAAPVQVGDRITLLQLWRGSLPMRLSTRVIRRIGNAWLVVDHATVTCLGDSSRLHQAAFIQPAPLTRFDFDANEEGTLWLRGHVGPKSAEARALLAAWLLTGGIDGA